MQAFKKKFQVESRPEELLTIDAGLLRQPLGTK